MTIQRLAAIIFIFLCSTVAWSTLGTSIVVRTGEHDASLAREVELLWGGPHVQSAPAAWVEQAGTVRETVEDRDPSGKVIGTRQVEKATTVRTPAALDSSRVDVALDLAHRQKGLLWYDTYAVRFRATYRFRNPHAEPRPLVVEFGFPAAHAIYDDFSLELDGRPTPPISDLSKGVVLRGEVAPGGEAVLTVGYRSRGLDTWAYRFGASDITQVRDFALTLHTGFEGIDFPPGTMSPSAKQREGQGWALTWQFSNLVTGQRVGLDLPNRVNPGPFASRVTFFAPVSLLFFFTVLLMLGVVRGENLHPMNYFFIAAAFFAFHLLLAYLADHVAIQWAFGIAAATSVGLVVSYLLAVAGARRMVLPAAVAQGVFLVLFSYAFFFEGYTGLTVTVGAVATLLVLMQMTARVDWTAAFNRGPAGLSVASALGRQPSA